MRSGIIAAAFAATAIAVPLQERAVVTNTAVEMVYVTDYVTVTANGPAPTEDAAPTQQNYHWGHNPHWWDGPKKQHTKQPAPAPQPTDTYVPAPAPTTDWAPAPTSPAPEQPTDEPSAPPSSGAPPSDYQGLVTYHHNAHRANHSSPEIQWDSALAATAKKIADSCNYGHDTNMDGGGYGQNIAAGVDDTGIARVISDMFYNGEVAAYEAASKDYTVSSPGGFETWGHMSQVVWANTLRVGCATTHCTGGLMNTGGNVPPWFTVCNYGPPGNVAGMYGQNVGKSKGLPTVSS